LAAFAADTRQQDEAVVTTASRS